MQIHVNTDEHIKGGESLSKWVEAEVSGALGRFGGQIMRVEVHLSDENSGKPGANDKRCLMEARLTGHQPVAVSQQAPTLNEAVNGAAQKLERTIENTLGRLKDHDGRDSIRREGGL